MPTFEAEPCVRLVLRWKPDRDERGFIVAGSHNFFDDWQKFELSFLKRGEHLVLPRGGGGIFYEGKVTVHVCYVLAEHWDKVLAWFKEQGVKERGVTVEAKKRPAV